MPGRTRCIEEVRDAAEAARATAAEVRDAASASLGRSESRFDAEQAHDRLTRARNGIDRAIEHVKILRETAD